jgi:hypothetical protein
MDRRVVFCWEVTREHLYSFSRGNSTISAHWTRVGLSIHLIKCAYYSNQCITGSKTVSAMLSFRPDRLQKGHNQVLEQFSCSNLDKHETKWTQFYIIQILRFRHSIQTGQLEFEELALMGLATVVADSETLVSQPRNGSQQNYRVSVKSLPGLFSRYIPSLWE